MFICRKGEINNMNNVLERDNIVTFWKEKGMDVNNPDKRCLSQWAPSEFMDNGVIFKTAEHYMMYHKAILFRDEYYAKEILKASHPSDCKTFGRRIRDFDSKVWNEKKLEIVVRGNLLKFSQNPLMFNYLLKTEDKYLIEASPYDTIWGVGMVETNNDILDKDKWKGENLLGEALMTTRHIFRNGLESLK